MTIELYKFQREDVFKIEEFGGRVLLASEMGTGKTAQALYWANNYLHNKSTILVICPASIKWNWQREAARFCNLRGEVLSGRKPAHKRLPPGRLYIINYDLLPAKAGDEVSWLGLFVALQPDLVIVDECHMIKSREAKRTKAVKLICNTAPHVIMISGTPLTNRPAELFPALNILYPKEFPSFTSFAWRYCDPRQKPWGMEFKGATHLEELHAKLNDLCMIRRRKRDVLKQLPAKTRNVILIELNSAAKKEYNKAEKDFIQWLRKLSPAKARSAERAEYLVKRGYLKRLAGILKQGQCIEWLENFLEETDEKLIFFGVHKKFLRPIYEHFKQTAVMVDGSVCGKDRQIAFDSFTNLKKKRLLIGNNQAAGVGWNGQIASNVAFGELGWTPGEHTQAEDRTHRIGQQRGVMCHYLVSKGTLEENLCLILQEKQEVLTSVLDGSNETELDIMIRLEEAMFKRQGVEIR